MKKKKKKKDDLEFTSLQLALISYISVQIIITLIIHGCLNFFIVGSG